MKQEFSFVLAAPRASELTETYKRTWSERLLSWPWRPWQATGTRLTTFGLMMQAHQRTRAELECMAQRRLFNE